MAGQKVIMEIHGHHEDCSRMENVCNMWLNRKYRIHSAMCTITTVQKYACRQRPKGTRKSENSCVRKAGMRVRYTFFLNCLMINSFKLNKNQIRTEGQ